MDESAFVVACTALMILAGLAVLYMAMQSRRQIREMEHRERLAMIERGLVPSPEIDPGGFEANLAAPHPPESRSVTRWRSAGVMMIGMGSALMFLMSFTPAGEIGIGIGGAFALIGAAFFVNSTLLSKSQSRVPRPAPLQPRRPDAQEPRPGASLDPPQL